MDDAFIRAFCQIDKTNSGKITADELREYMAKNNYQEDFVDKWLKLFDHENTGRITLEEFCETLGLEIEDFIDKRAAFDLSSEDSLMNGITILNSTMTSDYERSTIKIIQKGRELHPNQFKKQSSYIKQNLDKEFELTWHCIIAKGQYWAFFSCEPESTICVQIENIIYLLWKTP